MSALLAHEIRTRWQPGKLFAGLLAERIWKGKGPRWIEHVQAGLRRYRPPSQRAAPAQHAEPEFGQHMGSCSTGRRFLAPLPSRRGWKCRSSTGSLASSFRRPAPLEAVLLNLALNGSVHAGRGMAVDSGQRGGGSDHSKQASRSRCGIPGRGLCGRSAPHV